MISGGEFSNQDAPSRDEKKDLEKSIKDAEKSDKKLTPEEALKAKRAAAAVIQELMKTEGKKRTPRLLWYLSGCILFIIVGIIASFLIPLLVMVSDAKDLVRQHLGYLQADQLDEAFKLCDQELFGSKYLSEKIFNAENSLKTNGITDEFREFSKELMRDKFSESKMELFLQYLANDQVHEAVELCDVEYFAKVAHDEMAQEFKQRLDKSPYEVQKFTTVEKPPAVRGQFMNTGEYFTYNVFNDETLKISNFRLGFPKKSEE